MHDPLNRLIRDELALDRLAEALYGMKREETGMHNEDGYGSNDSGAGGGGGGGAGYGGGARSRPLRCHHDEVMRDRLTFAATMLALVLWTVVVSR